MTVLFRSCGDITKAPAPRSEKDTALYKFLSERTGLEITHTPGQFVDYEDWMEPVKMLEAALKAGFEIKILSKSSLPVAVADPIAHIPGTPCRDVLIGRYLNSDPHKFRHFDLGWPSAKGELANHYGELDAFRSRAGRSVQLADMPGELHPRKASFASAGTKLDSIPLGEAMTQFSGANCFVKQVYPAKTMPILRMDIPSGASDKDCEDLFMGEVGFHFARFEGEQGCLLVQEKVTMTHETRFFVIDNKVITAAACIEANTPQQNKGDLFDLEFEVERNKGQIVKSRAIGKALWNFAKSAAQAIEAEAPELKHYVLDLAIGEDGNPLIIELNPAAQSGLYGIHAPYLFEAIMAAAEMEPHTTPEPWDPSSVKSRFGILLEDGPAVDSQSTLEDDDFDIEGLDFEGFDALDFED